MMRWLLMQNNFLNEYTLVYPIILPWPDGKIRQQQFF
jgi:hypothetical protein